MVRAHYWQAWFPLNCLFLVHNHKNRGSYFRALEIARRFVQAGHQVQFAFTSSDLLYRPKYYPDPVQPNLLYAEMPCFTFFNSHQEGWSFFDNGWRVKDALSRKWDLVYAFSHKPCCVLPALAAKARGAKVVMDWADWWGGPEGIYRQCVVPSQDFQAMPRPTQFGRRIVFALEEWWEPLVYRFADLVTLIGEEYYLHARAPKDLKSKSIVMHSGAPLDQIRPVDKAVARESFGLSFPEDAVVLGYVANFHMDEALLIEAFAQVCRQRPNVYLLLAGAPLEVTTPEQHAATNGRIHHLGWQPFERMEAFLGAADILLLPLTDIALDRARYPHKLSDYVASGRPIVACDVGETGTLLRRYNFGKLSAATPAGFASCIVDLVDQPGTWNTLGCQTREVAEAHFDWDGITRFLLNRVTPLT